MRIISILLLFVSLIFAQDYKDTLSVSADSLHEKSISLVQAWKYSPGDNPEWASIEYDDSEWDTLNPKMVWKEFDDEKWKGIGWFRKYLKIDSSLFNTNIALSMNHFGASDIYLNGKLIHSFGTVSSIPDSEQVNQPNSIPITVNLGIDSVNLIAVRYSNTLSISDPAWIDTWYGHIGFMMSIHETEKVIRDQIIEGELGFGVNFAIGGVFLSLAALYFLLYLFYSKRIENLYYALFSFSLALLFPSGLLPKIVFENFNWIVVFRVMGIVGIGMVFLSFLAFIYSIFYEKIPKQIWFFILGTLVMGVLLFIKPLRETLNYILPVYIFIATIEGFRAIIIAIKRKKAHSWVIGTGVIVFVIFILTVFAITLFELNLPNIIVLILFISGLFSLPASMSVYLARNIATANKKLEAQVIEIKELSSKELKAQQKNAELQLETEREIAAKTEAELRAKAAELQAKAGEAERRMLQAENDRKTKELEEARNLQLSMLPKELPQMDGFDIAVHMETATEVGGDYYDFHLDDRGELTVLVGDATGHGLNAGTMVTATKSLFNSYASDPDIVNTFDNMSHSLRKMNFKFLSMCLMLMKIKDNSVKLSSAGMPPVLIYRGRDKSVEEILIKGMPLGSARAFPYELKEFAINNGDTILIMSDGLPELFNKNMEMYGYSKIKEDFRHFAGNPPEIIIEMIKKRMKEWAGTIPAHDDVTLVVIQLK